MISVGFASKRFFLKISQYAYVKDLFQVYIEDVQTNGYMSNIRALLKKLFHNKRYQIEEKALEIVCPNCKYPYNFNFKEKTVIKSIKDIKFFDSKDKILLLFLFLMQIVALFYDFAMNSIEYSQNQQISILASSADILLNQNQVYESGYSFYNYQNKSEIIHTIHLITVFILLCAAGFNIWDVLRYNLEIEIQDLELEDSQQDENKNCEKQKNVGGKTFKLYKIKDNNEQMQNDKELGKQQSQYENKMAFIEI